MSSKQYFCKLSLSEIYETVVGLEVHAQLSTRSKLFCGDSTVYGAAPNTQVSAITLAHPGTLPKLNRKAVEYAVKMGLACGSRITTENYFARKNYFYPDLPKGYQVTQHTTPVCMGGSVRFRVNENQREIQLHHIHLEEDAGKSIHDLDPEFSSIDINRAGTPLIEIVTEPGLHSGDEAYWFLYEIRKLVRYLGICDGNMEEGSLRCDANVSVRKKGETVLGTKIEIKNLNSMRFVRNAINYEAERLMNLLERGERISQETRNYNDRTGTTSSSREKEDADDYRYFPEPDLPPFIISEEFIETVRRQIPSLPSERFRIYTVNYGLSAYDAEILTEEKLYSDYFESVIEHTGNYKAAANWMLGPIRSWMNDNKTGIEDFPVKPSVVASIIGLVDDGKLSFSIASNRLLSEVLKEPGADPLQLAIANNLLKEGDVSTLEPVIDEVLQNFADKVQEYRKGKKGILALFVGEVMKRTKGKADPKLTNEMLIQKINRK